MQGEFSAVIESRLVEDGKDAAHEKALRRIVSQRVVEAACRMAIRLRRKTDMDLED